MAGFSRTFGFLRRLAGTPPEPAPADPAGFFGVCPRCGRCLTGVAVCPDDGSPVGRTSYIPLLLERRYRCERLLGYGGMGSVYRGTDVLLNRPIAIKVISQVLRDTAAEVRLLREAGILSRLQHPSIVAIYDYGQLPDRSPYLVMELVEGQDLRHHLVRDGRIAPERAKAILSAICAAMSAAHEQGILHCDLKPENVLLPEKGVDAKVLDFGVARALGDGSQLRRTASGGRAPTAVGRWVVGTPAYMAPELLRGQAPDERTDIFSLGVIAYEMLAGFLPFGGGSVAEVALAQARGLPPAPETVPAALLRAVHAALALDADRRPPSPQALAYLIGAATGAA